MSSDEHAFKDGIYVILAPRISQGLFVIDPRIDDDFNFGIVAKKETKAPTNLGAAPMPKRYAQRIALSVFVACRVAGNRLQHQAAEGAKQFDVGVCLEAFRGRFICSIKHW